MIDQIALVHMKMGTHFCSNKIKSNKKKTARIRIQHMSEYVTIDRLNEQLLNGKHERSDDSGDKGMEVVLFLSFY